MCGPSRYWITLAALLLEITGCGLRKPSLQTYRLIKLDTGRLLIPPGVSNPAIERRTFTARIVPGRGDCAQADGGITIERRKKSLRISVYRSRLSHEPPGWLGLWSEQAEAQGCLPVGQGFMIATRIAESLPLEPNLPFRLLHGDQRGGVDLGPGNRLQLVSPIVEDGAPADSPLEITGTTGDERHLTVDLKGSPPLGYEIVWYEVRRRPSGFGFTLAPIFVERRIQGKVEAGTRPSFDYFHFPDRAAFYRLSYKASQEGAVMEAVVTAGATRGALAEGCAKPAERMCAAIPKRVAINPYIVITVNGSEAALPVGATVHGAIRAAGEKNPASVLPRLSVWKPYADRPVRVQFDRNGTEILGLTLHGGEQIAWR